MSLKKTPFGGQFQKSGSVMHCAYVLAQTLYLDVRAGHTLRHPLCGPLESGHTFQPSPVYADDGMLLADSANTLQKAIDVMWMVERPVGPGD